MIGQTISHYKILEKLGEGGMGVVYKAEDTKLGRTVALKFLPPELTRDSVAKERFIHEAHSASQLDDPNICTIHEIDETNDGASYISMACYDGETLKQRLEKGPLGVAEAIDLAIQIARGLITAHGHGIVHRDIKPGNIMITSSGVVKILDFGLAKLAGTASVTKPGFTVGTVAYMAPEQARGETIDNRSDIWSLGVVLYEMLAGRTPFRSDYEQALVYEILNEEPKPLSEFRRKVPDDLGSIMRKALAKDPAERYQRVEEMLADLCAVREHHAVGTASGVRRVRLRWKRILGYVVAALVLIMAGETLHRLLWPAPEPRQENLSVGILPFEDQTREAAVADLVPSLQRTFVSELSGMKNLGISDPSSLNALLEHELGSAHPAREPKFYDVIRAAKFTYLVDGWILRSGSAYRVQSNIINPSTGDVIFSADTSAATINDLSRRAAMVSEMILSFFLMTLQSNATPELTPWLEHKTKNPRALIAFMSAYQMIYSTNVKGANIYLRRAIELDSTFVTPRLWLIASLASESAQVAEEHFRTLQRLESGSSPFEQTMIKWTGAYLADDQPGQERYLQKALTLAPRNNILLLDLAQTQIVQNKYTEAVEALLPAVESRWNYWPPYYFLAECYDHLGKYDKAREALEQSLSVTSVDPKVYRLLFTLMVRKGDTAKATVYKNLFLQGSRDVGGSLDASYASLAMACATKGFDGEAVKCYRSAVELRPDTAWYHDSLGNALYRQGNASASQEEYLRAITCDPKSVNAHRMLGRITESQGRPEEALRHYREYLRIDSTSAEAAEVRNSVSRLNH